ncbi:MAG TPA: hypothetical protein EYG75_05870 [Campylobacterales bacterium]|nr:hypothetical protein [Campylobacterales bacterium]
MLRKILLFVLTSSFAFSATCKNSEILGIFPKIPYFTCTDYALFIGFVGIVSATLFWHQVTK